MLVLSRKAGERIDIGDDIKIEVRKVAGNRVTIALEAPRHLRILRSELRQAATEFEITAESPKEDGETDAAADDTQAFAVIQHRVSTADSVPA